MDKKYQIKPVAYFVKDEASIKFHVENNDYFGTIAAVLSLVKQEIKKGSHANAATLNKIFSTLEKDLMLLQKNYHINPNSKKKKKTP